MCNQQHKDSEKRRVGHRNVAFTPESGSDFISDQSKQKKAEERRKREIQRQLDNDETLEQMLDKVGYPAVPPPFKQT